MASQNGIYRVDDPRSRTHAWVACVRRKSGTASRTFSDGRHGGRKASWRQAHRWRRQIQHRFPKVSRLERMVERRRNNRSGVAGVYRWPADGSIVTGAYWGAQWVPVPRQRPKRRKFSIAYHGEEEAKRLAVRARNRAIRSLRRPADMVSA